MLIGVFGVILLLAFSSVHQTWNNREFYIEEKPYRVLKPVVHILELNSWNYVVTYVGKDGLLEKERIQTYRNVFFVISGVEPSEQQSVEFFRGYRKPFLWYHDTESAPYVVIIEIHKYPN
ncbi:MAG: hypothetical protein A3D57_01245 [Candidatus Sungbacteria bacterium RIFCSPHIGHO2_02_FULL_46_12]|nr:MAG: hypothetical protein A3D57_01245 [Candidatus Sungbacteria bacterium RIFCSPHIGHO2_02_FULL_46_12]